MVALNLWLKFKQLCCLHFLKWLRNEAFTKFENDVDVVGARKKMKFIFKFLETQFIIYLLVVVLLPDETAVPTIKRSVQRLWCARAGVRSLPLAFYFLTFLLQIPFLEIIRVHHASLVFGHQIIIQSDPKYHMRAP